jgi:hypothetical protein
MGATCRSGIAKMLIFERRGRIAVGIDVVVKRLFPPSRAQNFERTDTFNLHSPFPVILARMFLQTGMVS